MPKLFCFSDVHGFYNELKDALDKAGFDENNENHFLIGAGDFTDRGPDPEKVIDYLMSLDRFIGIMGNHESLIKELVQRKYPMSYDWHNGSMQTIIDLAPNAITAEEAFSAAWEKLKPFYDKLVDYVELEHHVICHGYIPYNKHRDWRKATPSEWEDARWVNGMEMAMNGYTIDKCVVCGHFHTSWGHALQDKTFDEWGEDADFSPFYYEDKLIAIDGCTAYSGRVNILTITDNFI